MIEGSFGFDQVATFHRMDLRALGDVVYRDGLLYVATKTPNDDGSQASTLWSKAPGAQSRDEAATGCAGYGMIN